MNYRFDNRSESEFKRDIKDRTLQERELFFRWLEIQEKNTGTKPVFIDTGCGSHGEFLEDDKVSYDADFDVEGIGPLEVKFAKPLLVEVFHLKVGQVASYIKQGATLLMVNGINEPVAMYTMISVESLQEIVDECEIVKWRGFGFKPSYRIPVDKFVWRAFE